MCYIEDTLKLYKQNGITITQEIRDVLLIRDLMQDTKDPAELWILNNMLAAHHTTYNYMLAMETKFILKRIMDKK
jgi:hypothetical protein